MHKWKIIGNGPVFIEDGVDDVCVVIAPRLQNGLSSVVPHYKALREWEQEVLCSVIDRGCCTSV